MHKVSLVWFGLGFFSSQLQLTFILSKDAAKETDEDGFSPIACSHLNLTPSPDKYLSSFFLGWGGGGLHKVLSSSILERYESGFIKDLSAVGYYRQVCYETLSYISRLIGDRKLVFQWVGWQLPFNGVSTH